MNSMETQSKTTSKPGPLCSKRAVENMENEGDLEIQEKCNRCKQPAEVKCTHPTCAQMKKEYLCRRCDNAYHNPSYISRDGHKRVSIIEAGKFGQ